MLIFFFFLTTRRPPISTRTDPLFPYAARVRATWGWKGGQQLDLGTMPAPAAGFGASAGINSLKYSSQWRFAPDGRKAICLRDYGTFGDYRALGDNRSEKHTS